MTPKREIVAQTKKVYLGNDFLEDEKTNTHMESLLLFETQPKSLLIYINSGGGDITNGIAVMDAIALSAIPTFGVAIGSCMSMAVNVFLSCKYRLCTPSTYFMIHQSSYEDGLKGAIETIKENIRVQDEMDDMLNSSIIKNTLITKENLKDYFQHKSDMYFNAKQALEYGIVSKIVKSQKEIDKFIKENLK